MTRLRLNHRATNAQKANSQRQMEDAAFWGSGPPNRYCKLRYHTSELSGAESRLFIDKGTNWALFLGLTERFERIEQA